MADRFLAFWETFEPPAVDDEDVEPVVVVVVEEGYTAAGGLKQIFVAMLATENCFNVEARGFCYVGELDAERRADDVVRRAFGRGSGLSGVGFARSACEFLLARLLGGLLRDERAGEAEDLFKWEHERSAGERTQKAAAGEVGEVKTQLRVAPERRGAPEVEYRRLQVG